MSYNLKNSKLYFLVDLHMIDFEIAIEIEALRLLLKTQEDSIHDQRIKFNVNVESDAELQKYSGQDKAAYYDFMYGFPGSIIDEHERLQRYAIINSIYSYFEARLKTICEFIEDFFHVSGSLATLNENELLLRYWKFLLGSININSKKLDPIFTIIKQDKLLKNVISHQDGILTNDQLNKVNIRKGVNISNNRIELVGNTYGTFMLNNISKFFSLLIQEIDNQYEIYITK